MSSPQIQSIYNSGHLCPFMNAVCQKLSQGYKPVCAVRNTAGKLWIVCRHRLCATKKDLPLTDYQKRILHDVAKSIFSPTILPHEVLIKRESPMPIGGGSNYFADFVMADGRSNGTQKVILEMQGGGETSNTGLLTAHISNWETQNPNTNTFLSRQVSGPGLIITNAWRRQQEQFLVKGRIAMQTGRGFSIVFCVGSLLFDYLISKIQNAGLRNLENHNWTLALIGFDEDSAPAQAGPIPLKAIPEKRLYTDYQAFVRALTDQGEPCAETFSGNFESLTGEIRCLS